ncbi:MAG: S8 family serine peptidase, partial [Armatimonadota bacterium]
SSRITVAVIDSGVANHPDLINRIVAGYDFNENDADPSNDTDGHGTHVAGTIAAQGNNGIGICGVCWNGVKIMPLRLFGPNEATTDIFIDCLDYALTRGAQMVNMSLGQEYDDPTLHAKISQLATAGLILVASSGNSGDDTLYYPAAYPECISVSAIGPYDAIAPYSSYGKVDIAAPGGDSSLGREAQVYSTYVTWSNNAPVFTYSYAEGTSMAAPHVSGAAALLLGYNVPPADVRNRLLASARPPKSGGMDPAKYGAGILDVQAALANAVVRIVQPGKGATVGTTPDFRISIQGINKDTYEKIMGLNYERTFEGINRLTKILKERKVNHLRVVLSMVNVGHNESEIRRYKRFWRRKGIKATSVAFENKGGNIEESIELAPFGMKQRKRCYRFNRCAYIVYNGDVILCCADWSRSVILGNVKENSLKEIWQGEKLNEIRENFIKGNYDMLPEICRNCKKTRLSLRSHRSLKGIYQKFLSYFQDQRKT